ncbi:MAG: hypothetical protein ABEH56_08245 [Salinirussus sp.]
MPEISVTDDQHGRLEEVRRDVEEAFVDTYGCARIEDAIEYLLDTYTPPEEQATATSYDLIAAADYPALQRVASEVPDVPGSGIEADEMRGRLLSELGSERLAAELEAVEDAGTDGAEATAADGQAGEERTADEGGAADDAAGSKTDLDRLAAANQLLDEHEDRWGESDGDAPYEVDLPDGTTRQVRTRDDVRELLFRHYGRE